jgi:hypothetical protein
MHLANGGVELLAFWIWLHSTLLAMPSLYYRSHSLAGFFENCNCNKAGTIVLFFRRITASALSLAVLDRLICGRALRGSIHCVSGVLSFHHHREISQYTSQGVASLLRRLSLVTVERHNTWKWRGPLQLGASTSSHGWQRSTLCIRIDRMAPASPMSIQTFAATQLYLLAAEQQAEIDESSSLIASHSPTALQRAGLALNNLVVTAQRTGLGGKTVLELGPDPATSSRPVGGKVSDGSELPEHGLRTGDIVLVAEQPAGSTKKREVKELEKKGARGVITKVTKSAVGVALNDDDRDDLGGGRMWIVKVADEVTHRR